MILAIALIQCVVFCDSASIAESAIDTTRSRSTIPPPPPPPPFSSTKNESNVEKSRYDAQVENILPPPPPLQKQSSVEAKKSQFHPVPPHPPPMESLSTIKTSLHPNQRLKMNYDSLENKESSSKLPSFQNQPPPYQQQQYYQQNQQNQQPSHQYHTQYTQQTGTRPSVPPNFSYQSRQSSSASSFFRRIKSVASAAASTAAETASSMVQESKQDVSSIFKKVNTMKQNSHRSSSFQRNSGGNTGHDNYNIRRETEHSFSKPPPQPVMPELSQRGNPQSWSSEGNGPDVIRSQTASYSPSREPVVSSSSSFLDDIKASISKDSPTPSNLYYASDDEGDGDHYLNNDVEEDDSDNENRMDDETENEDVDSDYDHENYDQDPSRILSYKSKSFSQNKLQSQPPSQSQNSYPWNLPSPKSQLRSQPTLTKANIPPSSSSYSASNSTPLSGSNRNPIPSASNRHPSSFQPQSSASASPQRTQQNPFSSTGNQNGATLRKPYNKVKHDYSPSSSSSKLSQAFEAVLSPFFIASQAVSKVNPFKRRNIIDTDLWGDDSKDSSMDKGESRSRSIIRASSSTSPPKSDVPLPVLHLMQKTYLPRELSEYSSLGTKKAIMDVIALVFFIAFIRSDSWGMHALPCSVLTLFTSHLLFDKRIQRLSKAKAIQAWDESKYAQLWNRLVAAVPFDSNLPNVMSKSASAKVLSSIESKRLASYVALVTISILITTISDVRVLLRALGGTIWNAFNIKSIRSLPIEWTIAWDELKNVWMPWVQLAEEMGKGVIQYTMENPLVIVGKFSLFFALWFATFLPSFENLWRKRQKEPSIDPSEEEKASSTFNLDSNKIAALGRSSSSRLQLTSSSVIQGLLDRWKLMQTSPIEMNTLSLDAIPSNNGKHSTSNISSTFRGIIYNFLTMSVLSIPFFLLDTSPASTSDEFSKNISNAMLQLAAILFQTFVLTHRVISYALASTQADIISKPFLSTLSKTISSLSQPISSRGPSEFELQRMASPTKGISVSDVWTAHATKRAWATEGVSFSCRAGEVVLILGDEGMGKSRLLTSIAEIIYSPVSSAKSTIPVRGTVSIAGIDLVKNKGYKGHRERVGVMLNDVGSISDAANILSGCTLEEILEPDDGSGGPKAAFGNRSKDRKSASSMAKQKNAVKIALQVRS